MNKQKVDWMDIEELAANVCGIESEDSSEIENALYEKYEVSSEQFEKIVTDLFHKLDFCVSFLSFEAFVGFGDKGLWLLKKEVNQQFIAGLIAWATEGEEFKKDTKGFSRIITKKGKPEFEITIKRASPETEQSK